MRNVSAELVISDIFKAAWKDLKRNVWFYVGLMVVVALILYGIGSWQERTSSVASMLTAFVWQLLMSLGFLSVALKTVDGGRLQASDFWKDWGRVIPFTITGLLMGIITFFGFLLLIIPGIILAVALQFAPYLVVDKKKGPVEALYASAELTYGHRWQLFWITLLMWGLNFAGALFFVVGLLVTMPLSMLVLAHAYKRLERQG